MGAGLSKAAVYRVLLSQGHLYVVGKGVRRPMSYKHFLRRLKELGL